MVLFFEKLSVDTKKYAANQILTHVKIYIKTLIIYFLFIFREID